MKKYTALNDPLHEYVLAHRSGATDPILDALRKETETLGDDAIMAVSPEQCSFLTTLVAAIGATRAIEVGTFTGSSALGIARGLAPGGILYCFDEAAEWTGIARRHWALAGVSDRIVLTIGDAAETLPRFAPPDPIDFAFIDADKEGYDSYYETVLPLLRPNGLIAFDNMLRHGEIVEPFEKQSAGTIALDRLNKKLASDPRVQSVLLPIADGINLCRKLG